jgi:hypothetical protein
MESKDTLLTRLKEELKKSNTIILDLLRERETIKRAYEMQIDLREALEKRVKNLERNV